uniref:Dimer_Tnp_hAT domain-containing protein n=1 Tax=Caenorhabditis tropicalis TaxID=1561998 RepID=A0A1I7UVT0_9PELO
MCCKWLLTPIQSCRSSSSFFISNPRFSNIKDDMRKWTRDVAFDLFFSDISLSAVSFEKTFEKLRLTRT